jgi:hypothetical protein
MDGKAANELCHVFDLDEDYRPAADAEGYEVVAFGAQLNARLLLIKHRWTEIYELHSVYLGKYTLAFAVFYIPCIQYFMQQRCLGRMIENADRTRRQKQIYQVVMEVKLYHAFRCWRRVNR